MLFNIDQSNSNKPNRKKYTYAWPLLQTFCTHWSKKTLMLALQLNRDLMHFIQRQCNFKSQQCLHNGTTMQEIVVYTIKQKINMATNFIWPCSLWYYYTINVTWQGCEGVMIVALVINGLYRSLIICNEMFQILTHKGMGEMRYCAKLLKCGSAREITD